MTTTDVYYDPYDHEIDTDPYPVYARPEKKRPSITTFSTTSTPSAVSKTSSGARRPADLQFRSQLRTGVHQGEHRDPARDRHL